MENSNKKYIGYFAVYEPSKIYRYTSELDRRKLCQKYHGKKVRIEDGNSLELFKTLEQWVTLKRKIKYKVNKGDNTIYFHSIETAKVSAMNWKTSVIELGSTSTMEETIVINNSNEAQKNTQVKTKKQVQAEKIDKAVETIKEDISIQETTVDKLTIDNISSYINDNIERMSKFIENLNDTHALLSAEMSVIDMKIVDIEHKIEFTNAAASGGYKLYKLLHDTLVERREIKNNLIKIENVRNSHLGDNLTIVTKNITKLTENRSYRPRVLTDLFE